MSTRLLYFAWVKEKTGIAAEDVELPREVLGHRVDARLAGLQHEVAEGEEAEGGDGQQREQGRQLQPQVAGREAGEAEAGRHVGDRRGRAEDEVPDGPGDLRKILEFIVKYIVTSFFHREIHIG